VNQQKQEKTELEGIILSQRYSEHPGNVAAQSENVAVDSYNSGMCCFSMRSFFAITAILLTSCLVLYKPLFINK